MKGGRRNTPLKYGFTIIEVMIFLAVSGVTFLIAANFISGKESQTNFNQSINQINYQIRTIINDVANGNYDVPSGQYVSCSSPGQVNFVPNRPTPPNSAGCIFAGKIIEFNSNNKTSFKLLTESGCQYYQPGTAACTNSTTSGIEPQKLSQENIYTANTQTINWSGSLYMQKVFYSLTPSSTIQSIGFFANLPGSSTNFLSSSYQPFSIYYSTSQSLSAKNAIPLTDGGIVMCFSYRGLKGSVTITGGAQSNTSLQLGNNVSLSC